MEGVLLPRMPATRTPAQNLASRRNGACSRGPKSAAGRAFSSKNAAVHGLAAVGWLAPDETLEMYQACLQAWIETLRPAWPALVSIAHRIADVDFRGQRLARFEQRLLVAALEKKLKATVEFKKLILSQNALAAVQGLAALAECITTSMSTERVQELVRPMGTVRDMVAAADVPSAILGPLGAAIELFVLDSIIEVPQESFLAVASACRDAERDLVCRIPELELAVEMERERIGQDLLLLGSKELRLLDRHRARLALELERAMSAYRMALELAEHQPPSGSSVEVQQIRVTVIGRRAPRR